jgi:hypothetical protein
MFGGAAAPAVTRGIQANKYFCHNHLLLVRRAEVLRPGKTSLGSEKFQSLGGAVTTRHSTRGAWLIILASLIVMAICVYDYYTPETGLIGTGGTILVAVAGLLMLLAALVVAQVPNRSGLLQGFL